MEATVTVDRPAGDIGQGLRHRCVLRHQVVAGARLPGRADRAEGQRGAVDRITDFNVAADTIRLDNAVFKGLGEGWLAAGAFHTGTAAADAQDRIIYNKTTGVISFDADGSGSGAAVHFATVSPGLALTNADFFVI